MALISKQNLHEDLKKLVAEKGKTCISINFPLQDFSADRKADKLSVEEAIKKVKAQLTEQKNEQVDTLIDKLNKLYNEIEWSRNHEGIGLYASENAGYGTTFPFTVAQKIIVDNQFDLTNLLYKIQYTFPYYVLHLDEKRARFFTGNLKELQEITNADFPLEYKEDYEYMPPSRSTSYAGSSHEKGFEKDKPTLDKMRVDAYLLKTDELLDQYIKNNEELILSGVKRSTTAFMNRSNHDKNIIGVINGNYEWFNNHELSTITWSAIENYLNELSLEEISQFEEKIGEGLFEEGIINVWEAVNDGRGMTLLLEKDYAITGYLPNATPYRLLLKAPEEPHFVMHNACNNLLQMALEKDCNIMLVENGLLRKHQKAALITRY